MFGRHKMTHDGTATVVSLSDANHSMTWETHGYLHSKYDLVLDVSPVGAPMFRAPAEASFAILLSPNPGDKLKVRCNPAEQKVEVDVDDDPRFNPKLHEKARKARLEEERQRDLAAPPGTPSAAYSAGIADDPELMELIRLEAEHPYPEDPTSGT